jgi:hypothetical protein
LGRYSIEARHLDEPEIKAESPTAKKKGGKKGKKTRRSSRRP